MTIEVDMAHGIVRNHPSNVVDEPYVIDAYLMPKQAPTSFYRRTLREAVSAAENMANQNARKIVVRVFRFDQPEKLLFEDGPDEMNTLSGESEVLTKKFSIANKRARRKAQKNFKPNRVRDKPNIDIDYPIRGDGSIDLSSVITNGLKQA